MPSKHPILPGCGEEERKAVDDGSKDEKGDVSQERERLEKLSEFGQDRCDSERDDRVYGSSIPQNEGQTPKIWIWMEDVTAI